MFHSVLGTSWLGPGVHAHPTSCGSAPTGAPGAGLPLSLAAVASRATAGLPWHKLMSGAAPPPPRVTAASTARNSASWWLGRGRGGSHAPASASGAVHHGRECGTASRASARDCVAAAWQGTWLPRSWRRAGSGSARGSTSGGAGVGWSHAATRVLAASPGVAACTGAAAVDCNAPGVGEHRDSGLFAAVAQCSGSGGTAWCAGVVAPSTALSRDGREPELPVIPKIDIKGFFENQLNRPGGTTVWAIIAVNVAVLAVWRIPNHRIHAFMSRNFMSSAHLVRTGRPWTLLTSNYSHQGFLHIGLNMFAVAHFSPEIIQTGHSRYRLEFTPNEYLAMYVAAGVAGASASAIFGLLKGASMVPSLGASACALAVVTFYMLEYPKSKLYVMGIPMSCQQALTLSLLINGGGAIVSFFRHTGIDFVAHLGGMLVALLAYEQVKRRHLGKRSGSGSWPW